MSSFNHPAQLPTKAKSSPVRATAPPSPVPSPSPHLSLSSTNRRHHQQQDFLVMGSGGGGSGQGGGSRSGSPFTTSPRLRREQKEAVMREQRRMQLQKKQKANYRATDVITVEEESLHAGDDEAEGANETVDATSTDQQGKDNAAAADGDDSRHYNDDADENDADANNNNNTYEEDSAQCMKRTESFLQQRSKLPYGNYNGQGSHHHHHHQSLGRREMTRTEAMEARIRVPEVVAKAKSTNRDDAEAMDLIDMRLLMHIDSTIFDAEALKLVPNMTTEQLMNIVLLKRKAKNATLMQRAKKAKRVMMFMVLMIHAIAVQRMAKAVTQSRAEKTLGKLLRPIFLRQRLQRARLRRRHRECPNMPRPTVSQLVASVPLFAELAPFPMLMERIVECMIPATFDNNEHIIRQGESGATFYCVASGVCVERANVRLRGAGSSAAAAHLALTSANGKKREGAGGGEKSGGGETGALMRAITGGGGGGFSNKALPQGNQGIGSSNVEKGEGEGSGALGRIATKPFLYAEKQSLPSTDPIPTNTDYHSETPHSDDDGDEGDVSGSRGGQPQRRAGAGARSKQQEHHEDSSLRLDVFASSVSVATSSSAAPLRRVIVRSDGSICVSGVGGIVGGSEPEYLFINNSESFSTMAGRGGQTEEKSAETSKTTTTPFGDFKFGFAGDVAAGDDDNHDATDSDAGHSRAAGEQKDISYSSSSFNNVKIVRDEEGRIVSIDSKKITHVAVSNPSASLERGKNSANDDAGLSAPSSSFFEGPPSASASVVTVTHPIIDSDLSTISPHALLSTSMRSRVSAISLASSLPNKRNIRRAQQDEDQQDVDLNEHMVISDSSGGGGRSGGVLPKPSPLSFDAVSSPQNNTYHNDKKTNNSNDGLGTVAVALTSSGPSPSTAGGRGGVVSSSGTNNASEQYLGQVYTAGCVFGDVFGVPIPHTCSVVVVSDSVVCWRLTKQAFDAVLNDTEKVPEAARRIVRKAYIKHCLVTMPIAYAVHLSATAMDKIPIFSGVEDRLMLRGRLTPRTAARRTDAHPYNNDDKDSPFFSSSLTPVQKKLSLSSSTTLTASSQQTQGYRGIGGMQVDGDALTSSSPLYKRDRLRSIVDYQLNTLELMKLRRASSVGGEDHAGGNTLSSSSFNNAVATPTTPSRGAKGALPPKRRGTLVVVPPMATTSGHKNHDANTATLSDAFSDALTLLPPYGEGGYVVKGFLPPSSQKAPPLIALFTASSTTRTKMNNKGIELSLYNTSTNSHTHVYSSSSGGTAAPPYIHGMAGFADNPYGFVFSSISGEKKQLLPFPSSSSTSSCGTAADNAADGHHFSSTHYSSSPSHRRDKEEGPFSSSSSPFDSSDGGAGYTLCNLNLGMFTPVVFTQGDVLYFEGQRSEYVFLLVAGEVELTRHLTLPYDLDVKGARIMNYSSLRPLPPEALARRVRVTLNADDNNNNINSKHDDSRGNHSDGGKNSFSQLNGHNGSVGISHRNESNGSSFSRLKARRQSNQFHTHSSPPRQHQQQVSSFIGGAGDHHNPITTLQFRRHSRAAAAAQTVNPLAFYKSALEQSNERFKAQQEQLFQNLAASSVRMAHTPSSSQRPHPPLSKHQQHQGQGSGESNSATPPAQKKGAKKVSPKGNAPPSAHQTSSSSSPSASSAFSSSYIWLGHQSVVLDTPHNHTCTVVSNVCKVYAVRRVDFIDTLVYQTGLMTTVAQHMMQLRASKLCRILSARPEWLNYVPLCHFIPLNRRRRLMKDAVAFCLPAGSVLTSKQTPITHVFLVASGSLRMPPEHGGYMTREPARAGWVDAPAPFASDSGGNNNSNATALSHQSGGARSAVSRKSGGDDNNPSNNTNFRGGGGSYYSVYDSEEDEELLQIDMDMNELDGGGINGAMDTNGSSSAAGGRGGGGDHGPTTRLVNKGVSDDPYALSPATQALLLGTTIPLRATEAPQVSGDIDIDVPAKHLLYPPSLEWLRTFTSVPFGVPVSSGSSSGSQSITNGITNTATQHVLTSISGGGGGGGEGGGGGSNSVNNFTAMNSAAMQSGVPGASGGSDATTPSRRGGSNGGLSLSPRLLATSTQSKHQHVTPTRQVQSASSSFSPSPPRGSGVRRASSGREASLPQQPSSPFTFLSSVQPFTRFAPVAPTNATFSSSSSASPRTKMMAARSIMCSTSEGGLEQQIPEDGSERPKPNRKEDAGRKDGAGRTEEASSLLRLEAIIPSPPASPLSKSVAPRTPPFSPSSPTSRAVGGEGGASAPAAAGRRVSIILPQSFSASPAAGHQNNSLLSLSGGGGGSGRRQSMVVPTEDMLRDMQLRRKHELAFTQSVQPIKYAVGGAWEGLLGGEWHETVEAATLVEGWMIPIETIRKVYTAMPQNAQNKMLSYARACQKVALGLEEEITGSLKPTAKEEQEAAAERFAKDQQLRQASQQQAQQQQQGGGTAAQHSASSLNTSASTLRLRGNIEVAAGSTTAGVPTGMNVRKSSHLTSLMVPPPSSASGSSASSLLRVVSGAAHLLPNGKGKDNGAISDGVPKTVVVTNSSSSSSAEVNVPATRQSPSSAGDPSTALTGVLASFKQAIKGPSSPIAKANTNQSQEEENAKTPPRRRTTAMATPSSLWARESGQPDTFKNNSIQQHQSPSRSVALDVDEPLSFGSARKGQPQQQRHQQQRSSSTASSLLLRISRSPPSSPTETKQRYLGLSEEAYADSVAIRSHLVNPMDGMLNADAILEDIEKERKGIERRKAEAAKRKAAERARALQQHLKEKEETEEEGRGEGRARGSVSPHRRTAAKGSTAGNLNTNTNNVLLLDAEWRRIRLEAKEEAKRLEAMRRKPMLHEDDVVTTGHQKGTKKGGELQSSSDVSGYINNHNNHHINDTHDNATISNPNLPSPQYRRPFTHVETVSNSCSPERIKRQINDGLRDEARYDSLILKSAAGEGAYVSSQRPRGGSGSSLISGKADLGNDNSVTQRRSQALHGPDTTDPISSFASYRALLFASAALNSPKPVVVGVDSGGRDIVELRTMRDVENKEHLPNTASPRNHTLPYHVTSSLRRENTNDGEAHSQAREHVPLPSVGSLGIKEARKRSTRGVGTNNNISSGLRSDEKREAVPSSRSIEHPAPRIVPESMASIMGSLPQRTAIIGSGTLQRVDHGVLPTPSTRGGSARTFKGGEGQQGGARNIGHGLGSGLSPRRGGSARVAPARSSVLPEFASSCFSPHRRAL